ncbi:unnamed protein product [Mortierella alpina]
MTKPLLSTTITVNMNTITRLMLPFGATQAPAPGSTLTALAGASVAGTMIQGHGSSPKIFENHCTISPELRPTSSLFPL